MKKVILIPSLAAFAAFLVSPGEVRAGDGEIIAAAVGGVITGAIINEILDDDQQTTIVYKSGYSANRCYEEPRGYYEWRRVKIWVPGRYVFRYDRCGSRIRVWVPGYYSFERRKVWVPAYGHDHGRPGFRPGHPGGHPGRGGYEYGFQHDDDRFRAPGSRPGHGGGVRTRG